MIVFLNGQFVPEEQAVVSVFDRGFLYGDGLLETMRIFGGIPFRWAQHIQRLEHGAQLLQLRLPFDSGQLLHYVDELVKRNQMPDALLRLTLSRGVGPRGYSPQNADHPTLVLSLHPAPANDPAHPPRWRVITASVRLPDAGPLAQAKTCNKLPQILARAEADAAGAQEALLLNGRGEVAEAAGSNVFWIQGGAVGTPPLASGALPGVTRSLVMEICRDLHIPCGEKSMLAGQLPQMDGVFLSLASFGIVEVTELDGRNLRQSPLVERIRSAYYGTLMALKPILG